MTKVLPIPDPGPYQLPAAQNVRVDVGEGTVRVVVSVLDTDGQGLVSISIPMTADLAGNLSALLPSAIAAARDRP